MRVSTVFYEVPNILSTLNSIKMGTEFGRNILVVTFWSDPLCDKIISSFSTKN